MVRRIKDRGYLYILIAVICLILLFIGYNKVTIISKKDKIDEESATVFNYIEEDSIVRENNLLEIAEDIDTDNFFLKLLVNSNSYMKVVLYEITGETKSLSLGGYFIEILADSIKPETYLKSQLPAFFNFVDIAQVSSSKYSIINRKDEKNEESEKSEVLEDILFVEDPDESQEGTMVVNPEVIIEEEEVKPPDSIKISDENPYILIYHTHGTEAYLPIKENTYHTVKRQYNVLTIGEIIAKVLSEKGHRVKHVDIYHDIPSYSESYPRSLATVQSILKEEKNIKIVFDIHRDGVPEDASYLQKAIKQSKINIRGVDVATFSLVIGPQNPNKEEILEFAEYIKSTSDSLYPGLCKGIIIKPYGKFNQFVCNHSALIEVGSNLNTIEEAKESAKLIAEILDKVIKGISE